MSKPLNRILVVFLIVLMLFLIGCGNPQPTDDEFYVAGWVLHNINDSTPTMLEINESEWGEYRFSYDVPGYSPERYTNLIWFFSPSQDGAAAGNVHLPVPLTQTVYAYVNNPVSENYGRNFSLDKSASINYIKGFDRRSQFGFDVSSDEIISDDIWNSIIPKSGEVKEFSFGGPYTPTSVMMESPNHMGLRGKLLQGKNSYVYRRTEIGVIDLISGESFTAELEKPEYTIYEDGVKIRERYMVRSSGGRWDENYFYGHAQDDKNYLVNITIPSYYATFNHTTIIAEFSTFNVDRSPPWLENLEISPRFREGENLGVSFTAKDEGGSVNSTVYFRNENGIWLYVSSLEGELFNAEFISSGEKIDLKIVLIDDSNNSQTYIIEPVSFKERSLEMELLQDKQIISPGTLVKFNGTIKDNYGGNVSNLFVNMYYNGNVVGKTFTRSPYWYMPSVWNYTTGKWDWLPDAYVSGGYFEIEFNVPLDYSEESNLSFVYGGTGAYGTGQHVISGFSQIFDEDTSVLSIETDPAIYFGENSIKVMVANVGKTYTEATVKLYVEKGEISSGNYYFNEPSELKETRVINLSAEEVSEEIFDLFVEGEATRITITIDSPNDANPNNDERVIVKRVYSNVDASVKLDLDGNFIFNESGGVTLTIKSEGLDSIYNVSYFLEYVLQEEFELENYVMVESGIIDKIERRSYVKKGVNVIFNETENYVLRASVNITGDTNLNNNFDFRSLNVKKRGADLYGWFYMRHLVIGEINNITTEIYNGGTEDSQNGVIALYYQKDCDDECDNLKLIDSRNIMLESYDGQSQLFEFTPEDDGYYTFVLVLNASNEVKPKDNVNYLSKNAKFRGADLSGYLDIRNLIVGEVNNITLNIENYGIENVVDGTARLYYQKEYCDNEEECNDLTLIHSINLELSPGMRIKDILEFTPPEIEDYTFVLVLNASNEVEPENNVNYRHEKVKLRGADLGGWMDIENLIVGEVNNITFNIRNEGIENVVDGTARLYYFEGDCYEEECNDLTLIYSADVELNSSMRMEEILEFTPEGVGDYTFVLVLNASNEVEPEDNVNYRHERARLRGADLYGWMHTNDLIVGEVNNITINMGNDGIENVVDGTANLYYQKEYCEEEDCNDLTLIYSGELELNSNGNMREIIEFTPEETGDYTFVLILNASNEVEFENNVRYLHRNAKFRGADLSGHTRFGNIVTEEKVNLSFYVYNDGSEVTKNATATLYYQKEDCPVLEEPIEEELVGVESVGESIELNCNELVLINFTDINIAPFEDEDYVFEFVFEETGYYTFILVLNASNEIDNENNVDYTWVEIKESGPDATVHWDWMSNRDLNLVKGQEGDTFWLIENVGTEIAENINFNLYLVSYPEIDKGSTTKGKGSGNGKDNEIPVITYELIGSQFIESLNNGEGISVVMPFVPEEKGYVEFMANLSLDNDVDFTNNREFYNKKVLNDGLDVKLDGVYFGNLILDESSMIRVYLRNIGNQIAENMNVSLYFDDELIESQLIGQLDLERYSEMNFEFTPSEEGDHMLEVVVELDGDVDLSDNVFNDLVFVNTLKIINFTLTNSNGNGVNRILYSEYGDKEPNRGNDTNRIIEFMGLNDVLILGNLLDDDSYAMIGWGELDLSENEQIISEYYGSLEQYSVNYYSVFANKLSFDCGGAEFTESLKTSYVEELGMDIDNLEDYIPVYCEDFDFSSKQCLGYWEELEDTHLYLGSEGIEIAGGTEESCFEAFGLTKEDEFSGNTTDLNDTVGDEIEDLVIEKPTHGKIKFKKNVNISRIKQNKNLLKKYIKITPHKIMIDTERLPEFKNISAEILFKNVNFRNPQILHNGSVCFESVCVGFFYNEEDNSLTVNVTGFSEFEIVEGHYCGDDSCNSGESCSSCTADCGVCDTSGDTTGGSRRRSSGSSCTPDWECEFGPCVDGTQILVCEDSNDCNTRKNKPKDQKICFIPDDCIDVDRDGYGSGKDCLGLDLDDDDPGITTISRQDLAAKLGTDAVADTSVIKTIDPIRKYVTYLVSTIVLVGALVLVFVLSLKIKEEIKVHKTLHVAKKLVKEARSKNYTEKEIRAMFRKKGWKKKNIDKIING